ncbi:MAG: hypothetical protein ACI8YI_002559 [Paracoccaceae bacterium]|jgi:hypothetical protein
MPTIGLYFHFDVIGTDVKLVQIIPSTQANSD